MIYIIWVTSPEFQTLWLLRIITVSWLLTKMPNVESIGGHRWICNWKLQAMMLKVFLFWIQICCKIWLILRRTSWNHVVVSQQEDRANLLLLLLLLVGWSDGGVGGQRWGVSPRLFVGGLLQTVGGARGQECKQSWSLPVWRRKPNIGRCCLHKLVCSWWSSFFLAVEK